MGQAVLWVQRTLKPGQVARTVKAIRGECGGGE